MCQSSDYIDVCLVTKVFVHSSTLIIPIGGITRALAASTVQRYNCDTTTHTVTPSMVAIIEFESLRTSKIKMKILR